MNDEYERTGKFRFDEGEGLYEKDYRINFDAFLYLRIVWVQ